MHFNPVVIAQDLVRPRNRVPDQERAELLQRTTALKLHRGLQPIKKLYHALERLLAHYNLADNLAVVIRKP